MKKHKWTSVNGDLPPTVDGRWTPAVFVKLASGRTTIAEGLVVYGDSAHKAYVHDWFLHDAIVGTGKSQSCTDDEVTHWMPIPPPTEIIAMIEQAIVAEDKKEEEEPCSPN